MTQSSRLRLVIATATAILMTAACSSSVKTATVATTTAGAPATTAPAPTVAPTTAAPTTTVAPTTAAPATTAATTTTTAVTATVPAPVATTCPDGYPAGVTCATVTVPVDPTKPTGPTLDIAVTVRRAKPDTWTSPIALIQSFAEPKFFAPERFTGHDVIALDARGVGRTGPNTDCPELKDYTAEINTRNLQPSGVAAIKACIAKLATAQVSLAAVIDNAARATDTATVRRSLGIDKWAIFTARGSADAVMYLLATDAKAITSVFAYTPYTVGAGITPNNAKDAFDRFATDCAGIPACTAKGDMQAHLATLMALPPVTTKTLETATGWPIVLDAVTARSGITGALSRSSLAAILPGLLGGEASGAANELIAGFYNSTPAPTDARSFAMLCQNLGFSEVPLNGGNDDHAGPFKGDSAKRMCDAIGPQPQMPAPPKSTGSIPVLVIVPSYESQGSEAGARAIFSGYPNLNVAVVPGNPNDLPEFLPCYVKTINTFFDAPTVKLDTTCLTSRDWVKFA